MSLFSTAMSWTICIGITYYLCFLTQCRYIPSNSTIYFSWIIRNDQYIDIKCQLAIYSGYYDITVYANMTQIDYHHNQLSYHLRYDASNQIEQYELVPWPFNYTLVSIAVSTSKSPAFINLIHQIHDV